MIDATKVEPVWRKLAAGAEGADYDWPIGASAKHNLLSLLPSLAQNFFASEPGRVNVALRAVIAPVLRQDSNLRLPLCNWIVAQWGGIPAHDPNNFQALVASFGGFTPQEIETRIAQLGMDRISSWSKLIAFAHPERYAIYDARASAALNCALAAVGELILFPIPESRNSRVPPVKRRLKDAEPVYRCDLTYADYVDLLRRFVDAGLTDSILSAEMMAFVASEVCCREFVYEPLSAGLAMLRTATANRTGQK